MSFAADSATKEEAQIQASNILARIEQAKNRGEVGRIACSSVCVCEGGVGDGLRFGERYGSRALCFSGPSWWLDEHTRVSAEFG
jgi:hypothetical protein